VIPASTCYRGCEIATDVQALAPTAAPARRNRWVGLSLPESSERVWAEHLALLLALAAWALPVTRATGGRNAGSLAFGLAATLPGLLLLLPGAVASGRLRGWVVVLGLLLPGTALVVCLTAPTGWAGGPDIAAYAYAPLLAMLVFVYASTSPARRILVGALICLAGLAQFVQGWLPWWRIDAQQIMTGTFHWHNQFATSLLPAALIGLAFLLWRVPRVQALGWVVPPLCVAGVILSTSRASLAALLVGWVLVGALAVRTSADRRRALVLFVAVSLLAALVTALLCSQLFFDQSHSPFAHARMDSNTLSSAAGCRLDFWRQGIVTFSHWPISGAGFHSFATAATYLSPVGWGTRSPWIHNGYLQAFSDGGLILGLPLLVATGLAIWLSVRLLWVVARWSPDRPGRSSVTDSGASPMTTRHRLPTEGWVAAAGPIALLLLLAHSLMDFDWSYPALFAEAGILVGLVAAVPRQPAPTKALASARGDTRLAPPERPKPWVVWTLTVACLATATFAITVDFIRRQDVEAFNAAAQKASPAQGVTALLAASQRPLADYEPAAAILRKAADNHVPVPRQIVLDALDQTARAGTADPSLQLLRAQVQADVLGQREQAIADSEPLLSELAGRPEYAPNIARVLVAVGQQAKARDVLLQALSQIPTELEQSILRQQVEAQLRGLRPPEV